MGRSVEGVELKLEILFKLFKFDGWEEEGVTEDVGRRGGKWILMSLITNESPVPIWHVASPNKIAIDVKSWQAAKCV